MFISGLPAVLWIRGVFCEFIVRRNFVFKNQNLMNLRMIISHRRRFFVTTDSVAELYTVYTDNNDIDLIA